MAKNEYIKIFNDVDFAEMPQATDERFGQSFFREVNELQVGFANNDSNPKILRVDQSGQWMGQKSFFVIPSEPVNNKRIKYQVDMQGNITATSLKTAYNGKRVRIINNNLEIYDSNGTMRMFLEEGDFISYDSNGVMRTKLTQGELDFYDNSSSFLGKIYTDSFFADTFLILGKKLLLLGTENYPYGLFFDDLAGGYGYWNTVMVLSSYDNAHIPIALQGGMYFNTDTGKFMGCEVNGIWRTFTTT